MSEMMTSLTARVAYVEQWKLPPKLWTCWKGTLTGVIPRSIRRSAIPSSAASMKTCWPSKERTFMFRFPLCHHKINNTFSIHKEVGSSRRHVKRRVLPLSRDGVWDESPVLESGNFAEFFGVGPFRHVKHEPLLQWYSSSVDMHRMRIMPFDKMEFYSCAI